MIRPLRFPLVVPLSLSLLSNVCILMSETPGVYHRRESLLNPTNKFYNNNFCAEVFLLLPKVSNLKLSFVFLELKQTYFNVKKNSNTIYTISENVLCM